MLNFQEGSCIINNEKIKKSLSDDTSIEEFIQTYEGFATENSEIENNMSNNSTESISV